MSSTVFALPKKNRSAFFRYGARLLPFIFKSLKRRYGPQHWWPAKTPFEVIVGAILTQNTSWQNVEKAIDNLKKKKALTAGSLSSLSIKKLSHLLRPAGYYNLKARRLRNFLDYLYHECDGNLHALLEQPLPELREKLLSINGIGPETSDSIILYAARKPIFVVDAYTRRLFSRLGVISDTASYEGIQRFFMDALPKREAIFNEYHALIVEHAKRICMKKPNCALCPLRSHCAYFQKHFCG